jgi:hypothetical protein
MVSAYMFVYIVDAVSKQVDVSMLTDSKKDSQYIHYNYTLQTSHIQRAQRVLLYKEYYYTSIVKVQ